MFDATQDIWELLEREMNSLGYEDDGQWTDSPTLKDAINDVTMGNVADGDRLTLKSYVKDLKNYSDAMLESIGTNDYGGSTIRELVQYIETETGYISNDFSGLWQNVNTLKTDVASIKTSVDTINTNIATMNGRVNTTNSRLYSVMGPTAANRKSLYDVVQAIQTNSGTGAVSVVSDQWTGLTQYLDMQQQQIGLSLMLSLITMVIVAALLGSQIWTNVSKGWRR